MFLQHNNTLDKIQKSLDEYIETKCSAFPRFYFLSADELLEILSQSKNPQAVQLGVLYLEFGGLWRLHAVDATRVHLTSMRVVSFPSLGPFGPRRDRDRRSSRDSVRTGSLKDQRPPTAIIPGDESYQ